MDFETLDKVFLKQLKNRNKGAVSAVIFDDEKIIKSFYDGYLDKQKKITPKDDSLFMIGSNTKVMTALGIFRLYEEGKLKLDDPITEFIPEFSVKSRMGEYDVTIENLLMHRAGIQCDLYDYFIDSGKKYEDIVESLKDSYRIAKPGTMFAYSNLGYTLLGIIIERISGKTYQEYLEEVLFRPMGMEVYFGMESELPESVSDRIARSYSKTGKRMSDELGVLIPAGSSTYTTLDTIVKMGQLLMNDGLYEGEQFYQKETIQLMKSLKIDDELDETLVNAGYGQLHHAMPLKYETGRILGHGGNTLYHHSCFNYLDDEKIGIVVFTNFEQGAALSHRLEEALMNAYLKEAGFKEKEKKEDVYVPFEPKDYVRRYDSTMGPIEFKVSDKGGLYTKIKNIVFDLRLNEEGWLCAKARPIWTKLPVIADSLKDMKFLQAKYFGRDVLIVGQRGLRQAVGDLYTEPAANTRWLKAIGDYKVEDKQMKMIVSRLSLRLKEGDMILTCHMSDEKLDYYLSCINESEAIVRGFGRNSGQTVFLKEEDGKFCIYADGIRAVRTK